MPPHPDVDAQLEAVAALGDPIRRALYRYVVAERDPVSRDRAAEGVGVARHVAKFHLDKLVGDGLLAVEYARPPGRSGPGAGRPAKLYRRSSLEVAVTLPPRDYELVGRLLAKAVTDAERDGIAVSAALARAARHIGRQLGHRARQNAGARPTASGLVEAASTALVASGYEPRPDDAGLVLDNCPFQGLSRDYTDLVCGMNLELITGLVDGLEHPGLEARLEPAPGRCCVRLYRAGGQRPPR